jgi:hypothetical protein
VLGVALRGEDLVGLVDLIEELLAPVDVLCAAEQQEARVAQRVVKHRDDPPLEPLIEVDEDVATARQIQPRERRIAGQIVLDEHAEVANVLADAISRARPC